MSPQRRPLRIMLADPPIMEESYSYYHPTMGILYLLGALRRHFSGEAVELRYLQGHMGLEDHVRQVLEFAPDLYGLSFKTPMARLGFKTLSAVKDNCPDTIVVAGGSHPTAMPEEVMDSTPIDACFRGECETTFPWVVSTIIDGEICFDGIPGVVHRRGSELVSEPVAPFDPNLDAMPRPAWDFVDFSLFPGMPYQRQQPYAGVTVSRGCPFQCTFCSEPVWKIHGSPSFRSRSVPDILEEIQYLYDRGVREIRLWCEELNCNHDWAVKLLHGIASLGHDDLYLSANVRGDKVTSELAEAMVRARLWLVNMGIESSSSRTLLGVKKQVTIDQIEDACQILATAGVKIMGYFQFFLAWEEKGMLQWETAKEARETIKWALGMHHRGWINYIGTTISSPRPSSPLWGVAQRHGLMRAKSGEPFPYLVFGR